MIECLICHKQFSKNIGKHLNYTHKMSLPQYYDLYLKQSEDEGKCKICGKPAKLANFTKDGPLFRNTCCDEYCLREYLRKVQKDVYIKHPEKKRREKIIKNRLS